MSENEYTVPILRTQLPTGELVGRLLSYLDITFAHRITLHGVLVDVFGVGLLILGKSGVGKSECALELIERGHRLVADDLVEIYRVKGGALYGTGSDVIRHHMEIRGVGVIDISRIFGVGVIRHRKRIELLVHLEEWIEGKEYDRLGLEQQTYKILDVKIPELTIPVAPGRNLSIILEVAAMNHRLKELGHHPVENLNKVLELYTEALTVFSIEKYPEDWAMTKAGIGLAYAEKGDGEKKENISKAIENYLCTQ